MNILAFFAHPDDETMLTGGTLALLAKRGANIHYVCATRGEGGEIGEPPVTTIQELGETREKEQAIRDWAARRAGVSVKTRGPGPLHGKGQSHGG